MSDHTAWQPVGLLWQIVIQFIQNIDGERELAGIPPEKEIIDGSDPSFIRRRISDPRISFAISENSTISDTFRRKEFSKKKILLIRVVIKRNVGFFIVEDQPLIFGSPPLC